MTQPDSLSIESITLIAESDGVPNVVREIAKQLLDTIRENRRLNAWLLSNGYDEICSEGYRNKNP